MALIATPSICLIVYYFVMASFRTLDDVETEALYEALKDWLLRNYTSNYSYKAVYEMYCRLCIELGHDKRRKEESCK